jgi:hypothetical protein
MNPVFYVKKLKIQLFSKVFKTYQTNICGHETKREAIVYHNGREVIIKMPLTKNGCPDYCFNCFDEMTTTCLCEKDIHVGEWLFEKNGNIVACWHCIELPVDLNGIWMPPGIILSAPFPFFPSIKN